MHLKMWLNSFPSSSHHLHLILPQPRQLLSRVTQPMHQIRGALPRRAQHLASSSHGHQSKEINTEVNMLHKRLRRGATTCWSSSSILKYLSQNSPMPGNLHSNFKPISISNVTIFILGKLLLTTCTPWGVW